MKSKHALYLHVLLPYLVMAGLVIFLLYAKHITHIEKIILWFLTSGFIFYKNYGLKTSIHQLHKKNPKTDYALDLLFVNQPSFLNQIKIKQLEKLNLSIPIKRLLLSLTLFFSLYFGLNLLSKNADNAILSQIVPRIKSESKREDPIVKIQLIPPAYTGLKSTNNNKYDIVAPENSTITWTVNGDYLLELQFENGIKIKGKKAYKMLLTEAGVYGIKVLSGDSMIVDLGFHTIEVTKDQAPMIEIADKNLFKDFDQKPLNLQAKISDDYLVNKVYILGTVARGNGENVKFRDQSYTVSNASFTSKNLKFQIDLTKFDFKPGDEFFYHWIAIDNRKPEANIQRSDTYFIVFKDPYKTETIEESRMSMNIMPEYFRSQRQIIIDTEKLIKQRKKQTKELFNSSSNEIGFDQKSLRLRYGQYLGEEFESDIGDHEVLESMATDIEAEHEHDHDEKTDDPLAALMSQYVHAHDDEEINTLYEQSTKSLLKAALEQMWQAELQLRLYEPEKALPFENKALKLLKEAQQRARNYAAKTGIEVTPIKEKETRLTGKLEGIEKTKLAQRNLQRDKLNATAAQLMAILETKNISAKQKSELVTALSFIREAHIKTIILNKLNDKDLSLIDKKLFASWIGSLLYPKNESQVHRSKTAHQALRQKYKELSK